MTPQPCDASHETGLCTVHQLPPTGEQSGKAKHIHRAIYSQGDNKSLEWDELLKLLDEGYEIVSGASDANALHYILVIGVEGTQE